MKKLDPILGSLTLVGVAILLVGAFHITRVVRAANAVPAMPTHLTIYGQTWQVTTSKMFSEHLLGETNCESRTIVVGDNMAPADAAEDLLHESLHALTCSSRPEVRNYLYNNLDDEHAGLHWAAPHIVSFLVENPDFVAYLRHYGRSLTIITAETAGGDGGTKPTECDESDSPLILFGAGTPSSPAKKAPHKK